MTLAAAFTIVLVAAAVQALTGFGFALVAVPLLQLMTDPRAAVVGVGLAGVGLSVGAVIHERRHIRWRMASPLIASAVVGLPLGLLMLVGLSDRGLRLLAAAAALGCTVLVWRLPALSTWQRPRSWLSTRSGGPIRWVALVGAGGAAGMLSSATGMNGPPLVAALQTMGYEPAEFRATLAAVFSATGVLSLIGFGVAGQIGWPAMAIGLAGAPGAFVGWWLGDRMFRRIDARRFRRMLLVALAFSSILIIIGLFAR